MSLLPSRERERAIVTCDVNFSDATLGDNQFKREVSVGVRDATRATLFRCRRMEHGVLIEGQRFAAQHRVQDAQAHPPD